MLKIDINFLRSWFKYTSIDILVMQWKSTNSMSLQALIELKSIIFV